MKNTSSDDSPTKNTLQEKDGENEANPFIGWVHGDSRIELRNSTSNTDLAGAAYLDLKCKDLIANSISGTFSGNAATATAL